MSNFKKRIYNSQLRKNQSSQTRQRILLCAKELFYSEGFEGVTIEMLAQAAEVSQPTIYSLFQSKKGVLRALMDEALPIEQFEALVDEGKKEIFPKKRLQIAAKIARQMYDAEKNQMDIFRGASVLAPELKELEVEREQRRYQRQEETVKILFEQKVVLPTLSLTQARDILWAFTGRDLYRLFVMERGWTSDEYEEWVGQVLIKSLLKEKTQN